MVDISGVGDKLQSKLKMTILTVISYHDVAFTFDAAFLTSLFDTIKVDIFKMKTLFMTILMHQELLHALIARHLTDRSKDRVENVFKFFSNGETHYIDSHSLADMLTHLYTDPAYKGKSCRLHVTTQQLLRKSLHA